VNRNECIAIACTVPAVGDRLFCPRHWSLLTVGQRDAIWRAADGAVGRDGPGAGGGNGGNGGDGGSGDGVGGSNDRAVREQRWYGAVADAVEYIAGAEGRPADNAFRRRAVELVGRAGQIGVASWQPGDVAQR
jgi:hypothetical protein